MAEPSAREKPTRPVAVTLVGVLAIAVTLYTLTAGILALRSGEEDRLADGIYHLALSVVAVVAAVGAFRLRPWGWAVFMTWAVIGLTHQILRALFFDDPNYVDMAINTFIVLALSPLDVQIAFRLRHTQNVELARPTRNPVDGD